MSSRGEWTASPTNLLEVNNLRFVTEFFPIFDNTGCATGAVAEANKLVRQQRLDVLVIEPFLESRDAIRWIKDLATEFPKVRILVVTRQSELTYVERALQAGASGYWMKNSSVKELMHAIETVLVGEIYASRAIASVAMRKFAGARGLREGLDVLSDREMAVFALIAAGHGTG